MRAFRKFGAHRPEFRAVSVEGRFIFFLVDVDDKVSLRESRRSGIDSSYGLKGRRAGVQPDGAWLVSCWMLVFGHFLRVFAFYVASVHIFHVCQA